MQAYVKSLRTTAPFSSFRAEVEESLAVLADAPALIKTRDDLGWIAASLRRGELSFLSTTAQRRGYKSSELRRGFRRPGVGL
jgi:hypothetical protein